MKLNDSFTGMSSLFFCLLTFLFALDIGAINWFIISSIIKRGIPGWR
jgi:hypothetical protein